MAEAERPRGNAPGALGTKGRVRMGYARALVAGAVVLLVGFGAGLLLSANDDDTPAGGTAVEGESAMQRTPPTTHQPAPCALGDRIQSGGLQLVVQVVDDPFEGANAVVTAPAGKRWVATEVEVTNMSDGPVTLSEQNHFALRDPANARFKPTDTAEDLPALDGVLSPGQTRRGMVVFELPENARQLRLVFSGAPNNAPPIVVSLG